MGIAEDTASAKGDGWATLGRGLVEDTVSAKGDGRDALRKGCVKNPDCQSFENLASIFGFKPQKITIKASRELDRIFFGANFRCQFTYSILRCLKLYVRVGYSYINVKGIVSGN